MNLRRIIREEIDKFLIREGVEELNAYSDKLQRQIETLANIGASIKEQEVNKWVTDFVYYTAQVIHGVNRCVSKGSLNEAWNEYLGIRNVPAALGGNIPYHFDKGYYWTKRKLGGLLGGKQQGNKQANMGQYNQHNVKSVRLAESLNNADAWSKQYMTLNSKYNLSATQPNLHKAVMDTFKLLSGLKGKYEHLVSTQKTT